MKKEGRTGDEVPHSVCCSNLSYRLAAARVEAGRRKGKEEAAGVWAHVYARADAAVRSDEFFNPGASARAVLDCSSLKFAAETECTKC